MEFIPGLELHDCGFPGITANQCAIKGCCFKELNGLNPYCFYPEGNAFVVKDNVNPVKDAVCAFSDLFRVSCGDGFNEDQCRNRGCCFSELSTIKCSFGFIPIINSAIVAPQVVNNQIQQGIVIGDGQVQIQGNQVGDCGNVMANLRVDCGHYGITEEECAAMNCCFGVLPKGNEGPVCFQKGPKNVSPIAKGYQKSNK